MVENPIVHTERRNPVNVGHVVGKDIGLLPVFTGTSDCMNTSEAYNRLILSKGLADTMPYDEFAVFWASKGISQFYKSKEQFEEIVKRNFYQNTGIFRDDLGDYFLDNLREFFEPMMKAVSDAMLRQSHKHNLRISTRQLIGPWIKEQVSDALLRQRFRSVMRTPPPGLPGIFATPPGGELIGIIIGIFVGGIIALNNTRRRRNTNRVNRDPSEYNQYRSYQGWKEEYVSDRYESWEPQNYEDIYYQYILVLNYIQMDGVITDEESQAISQIAIQLFGGAGGGGGGGGHWK